MLTFSDGSGQTISVAHGVSAAHRAKRRELPLIEHGLKRHFDAVLAEEMLATLSRHAILPFAVTNETIFFRVRVNLDVRVIFVRLGILSTKLECNVSMYPFLRDVHACTAYFYDIVTSNARTILKQSV